MLSAYRVFLKLFNCNTVNYLCWERIEEKMFRFIRSKTFTNDLEVIVMGGACEIGSYIVICVNIIKTMENFKNLN